MTVWLALKKNIDSVALFSDVTKCLKSVIVRSIYVSKKGRQLSYCLSPFWKGVYSREQILFF